MSSPVEIRGIDPDVVLGRVFGKRKWPGLPVPTNKEDALQATVLALVERSQTQSREAGNIEDSFVTVSDLLNLRVIDRDGFQWMRRKIEELEERIEVLEAAP